MTAHTSRQEAIGLFTDLSIYFNHDNEFVLEESKYFFIFLFGKTFMSSFLMHFDKGQRRDVDQKISIFSAGENMLRDSSCDQYHVDNFPL